MRYCLFFLRRHASKLVVLNEDDDVAVLNNSEIWDSDCLIILLASLFVGVRTISEHAPSRTLFSYK